MYEPSKVKAEHMYKMCLRKVKFPSEQVARKVADEMEIQYNCKNDVYFCPLCAGWHITTVKGTKNAEAK